MQREPNGPFTLNLPAGKTLWVTRRLQFSGIGGSSAGMTDICQGNVAISATGAPKDNTGDVIGTCTATATGYLNSGNSDILCCLSESTRDLRSVKGRTNLSA